MTQESDAEVSAKVLPDPNWYYGQINADEVEKLRRTDDPVWVVWQHTSPDDPDVCIIAAVTGDGPTSEEHASLFCEFLNERASRRIVTLNLAGGIQEGQNDHD